MSSNGYLGGTHEVPLTKTQAAYGAMRLAIEEGRIKPGVRLRIHTFEKELSMSPTPIREAMRLLQADGLVEHQPHRGMVVAEYSTERVEEVYSLRVALEPMATALACARASEGAISEIRAIHQQLVRSIECGPRAEAPRLNAAWHRAIYNECGSRYLQDFIFRLWNALPVQAVWSSSQASPAIAEHAAIMEALENGDAELARDLMRSHITSGGERTTERLRRALEPAA